ncbi:hypothetical protein RRSWK_05203 [Rhodopirellula sp. SWK7]|nr:hypothetical protein RRSWK_05203 [Rhodopirellula sp. SWK7]
MAADWTIEDTFSRTFAFEACNANVTFPGEVACLRIPGFSCERTSYPNLVISFIPAFDGPPDDGSSTRE